MEDISRVFTELLAELNTEILEYYRLTNSYLKDLIAYKNIELNTQTQTESEGIRSNTFEKILKAIKTGLNTLGLGLRKLNDHQNIFIQLANTKRSEFTTYTSFVDLYQRNHINELLFEVLMEYLLDIDVKKIENFKLFELLPEHFIEKISRFKAGSQELPKIKKALTNQDLKNYIDFSTLSIKKIIPAKPAVLSKVIKKVKEPEIDILLQLQEAKRENIEKLRKPIKDISPLKIPPTTTKQRAGSKIVSQDVKIEQTPVLKDKESFLNFYGNFPPIHSEILNKFEIDIVSLLNSRVKNVEFFDLENLFYYISNLKMLNVDVPFSSIEILEIVKKFVNGNVFSSAIDNNPDIKNNFYGLSIFSELDLIRKTDIINDIEILNFIKLNLKYSLPEKLQTNLYSLLCLNLLRSPSQIKNLYPPKSTEFKSIREIYTYLSILTLLRKEHDIEALKKTYLNEVKKSIAPNGSINDLFTDSAKALLIIDLLDLKEQEAEICSSLLNNIMKSTTFFSLTNINKEFNWRNNQMGCRIELKMLYWALLASSRYAPQ